MPPWLAVSYAGATMVSGAGLPHRTPSAQMLKCVVLAEDNQLADTCETTTFSLKQLPLAFEDRLGWALRCALVVLAARDFATSVPSAACGPLSIRRLRLHPCTTRASPETTEFLSKVVCHSCSESMAVAVAEMIRPSASSAKQLPASTNLDYVSDFNNPAQDAKLQC